MHVDAVDEVQPGSVDVGVLDRSVLDHPALDATVVHGELGPQPALPPAPLQPLPAFRPGLPGVVRPVLQAEAEQLLLLRREVNDLHGWRPIPLGEARLTGWQHSPPPALCRGGDASPAQPQRQRHRRGTLLRARASRSPRVRRSGAGPITPGEVRGHGGMTGMAVNTR